VADRLEALEKRVTDQLAEHAAKVQEMLARQDAILSRIEAALTAEQQAKTVADESERRLLAAADYASQVLRAASQDAAAEPAKPAK
jgi:hypothetical protein